MKHFDMLNDGLFLKNKNLRTVESRIGKWFQFGSECNTKTTTKFFEYNFTMQNHFHYLYWNKLKRKCNSHFYEFHDIKARQFFQLEL